MTADGSAPLVSVVIITYNQREFIEECLESVLTQDLSGPWEVIVADDASTDGTTEYLMDLAESHPRVRVLTTPHNLGAQRNLRRALNAATGEFVATLEGDDYWTDRSKLSVQADQLGRSPAAASAHRTLFLATDREVVQRALPTHLQITEALLGPRPHLSSLVFRRQVFPTTPSWFDEYRAADSLICCILAANGGIEVIDREMSTYRMHDASSWQPLPFAVGRLDAISRVYGLIEQTDVIDDNLQRAALRQSYGAFYSGLFTCRSIKLAFELGSRLAREHFWRSIQQLAVWSFEKAGERTWAQIRKRI